MSKPHLPCRSYVEYLTEKLEATVQRGDENTEAIITALNSNTQTLKSEISKCRQQARMFSQETSHAINAVNALTHEAATKDDVRQTQQHLIYIQEMLQTLLSSQPQSFSPFDDYSSLQFHDSPSSLAAELSATSERQHESGDCMKMPTADQLNDIHGDFILEVSSCVQLGTTNVTSSPVNVPTSEPSISCTSLDSEIRDGSPMLSELSFPLGVASSSSAHVDESLSSSLGRTLETFPSVAIADINALTKPTAVLHHSTPAQALALSAAGGHPSYSKFVAKLRTLRSDEFHNTVIILFVHFACIACLWGSYWFVFGYIQVDPLRSSQAELQLTSSTNIEGLVNAKYLGYSGYESILI